MNAVAEKLREEAVDDPDAIPDEEETEEDATPAPQVKLKKIQYKKLNQNFFGYLGLFPFVLKVVLSQKFFHQLCSYSEHLGQTLINEITQIK